MLGELIGKMVVVVDTDVDADDDGGGNGRWWWLFGLELIKSAIMINWKIFEWKLFESIQCVSVKQQQINKWLDFIFLAIK